MKTGRSLELTGHNQSLQTNEILGPVRDPDSKLKGQASHGGAQFKPSSREAEASGSL